MVASNEMANGVRIQRASVRGISAINHNGELPLFHPAPLPDMPNPQPHSPTWKKIPPRPSLKISKLKTGKF